MEENIKAVIKEMFVSKLQEISKETLSSYIKKVPDNATKTKFQAIAHTKRSMNSAIDADAHETMADKLYRRYNNRVKGVATAVDKLTK